jgi:hypothetical protein
MIELLLSRATVITLAALGGILAVLAHLLQVRGGAFASRARPLNLAAYVFMAASMFLFIVAGFWRAHT